MPKKGAEVEVATITGMAMTEEVVAADTDPTPRRDCVDGGHQRNIRVLSAIALCNGRVTAQIKKRRIRQVSRQTGRMQEIT